MCDVSIIIPIYNKQDHLSECIESILDQTYQDFEVICIEDCSTDKSKEILERFALCDKRIKLIKNMKNEGAGPSRNKGIMLSKGEYLLILDADDIFDKDLVQITYESCKREQLDILLFDHRRMDNITKNKRECSVPLPMQKIIKGRVFSKEDIGDFSFQMCLAAPWVKMYRKSFIMKSGIRFQNLSSSNDGFFGRSIFLLEGRFSYLSKSLVTYRTNTENQISRINEHSIYNFIHAVRKIKTMLETWGDFERNKKSFCSYVLSVTVGYLAGMNREDFREVYYDITTELSDILGLPGCFLSYHQKYIYNDLMHQTDVRKYLTVWNEYTYLFRYEKEKIRRLNEYLYNSQRKVALWGYGYSGREFFERSRITNTPIDLIVDENYINFNDSHVKAPEEIGEQNYIVLITMASYGRSILERAISINVNTILIDLQSYFTYGFTLEQCICSRDLI